MKLSTVSFLGLALSVAAEPSRTSGEKAPSVVERDLATITSVLSTISSQTNDLDTAIKSFSGDITAVGKAGDTLLASIKSGTTAVSATSPLTLSEAAGVSTSVGTLNATVAQVVNDLISKKAAIVSAGAGPAILKSLQDQKAASGDLSAAITSKVPTELQSVATQLSAGIAVSLQSGIDAFTGVGGGPSSSASSVASSASSVASSASSVASSASSVVSSASSHSASKSAASTSAAGSATSTGASKPSATSSSSPSAATTNAAATKGLSGAIAAIAGAALVMAV